MKADISENSSDLFEIDNDYRQEMEIMRSRLFLLRGTDKIIMSMHIEKGISYRKIALLLGVNPTSISRRIKKIKHTLTNGIYVSCLKKQDRFTQKELSIARDYFLKKLSM